MKKYNDVVNYINQWNDTYYRAANDIQNLIEEYYHAGSLKDLHPFYGLLDAMRQRSTSHAEIIRTLEHKLKSSVQELL